MARIKREIGAARTRAALAVNEELIQLYWRIGSEILARQQLEGWGTKVIERLSTDLRQAFPELSGLSVRNLKYMRQLCASWPEEEIVPRAVAQLPWGHVRRLLDRLHDPGVRLWYADRASAEGWSRKLLEHHIATRLHERHGGALTNFAETMPAAEPCKASEDPSASPATAPRRLSWSTSPRRCATGCLAQSRSAPASSRSSTGAAAAGQLRRPKRMG